jgi:transcriptional regulator with XRE-family HTH domain
MDSDLGRAITRRLLLARQAAKLTQGEVAAELRVSRQLVSKWEHGRSSPTLPQFTRMCALYGVAPAFLLLGTTETPTVLKRIMRSLAALKSPPLDESAEPDESQF